jgi:uncharacterized protein (TIGR02302 family)
MTARPANAPIGPAPLLATRLHLARAALLWETLWPICWPALVVLALFLIVVLFDLLPLLPSLVHAATLLAFGAGFLLALGMAFRDVVLPDSIAARRRIERASGLSHRPLQALADRPGMPLDLQATQLWDAHQLRMRGLVRRLRVGTPVAGLAARDPWGLRAVLALLLLIGAADAGGDWRDRLIRAVTPGETGGTSAISASLDIWVTPPEYTGLPPQFLRPENQQTIAVPIGSRLLAQVHGGGSVPRLAIDRNTQDFATADKQDFQAQATLTAGKRIEVSQDGTLLGAWPIRIIPDHPPAVAFTKPPEATARQALRIGYRASDDYGVERVKAVIRRPGDKSGDKIELELPLPGLHLKQAESTSYHDLTPALWAGLPVEIRLVASDALGQTGESEPVRMKLPERAFTNPVARAIIEQRKELAASPSSRLPVTEILGDLRSRPQLYHDDAVVFLALRVAQERLRLHGDAAAIKQVEQLLWDTALRIEDGQASLAQNELRRLQQQLQDALAKNAPDQEIERLMSELKQALDRYLQALAANLARHPEQAEQPTDPSQQVLTSQDLEHMLDRAAELAKNGARDQARELLSQLQNMLENLRLARPGQAPQGSSEAQQMMRGMRQLMQRQQQLLDRSFRAQQQADQGQTGAPSDQNGIQPNGSGDMSGAAQQQEELRHTLGEMMRRMGDGLGKIPDPLGRAERAMRDAAQALRGNRPGAAIGPQTDALDQLQQAQREFAQQMQQQLGSAWGEPTDRGTGTGPPRDGGDRDPLGRPTANDGAYDQGDVKIPDLDTMQRSRQILDELRRRAGERYRPQIELDYIDRLLQRF